MKFPIVDFIESNLTIQNKPLRLYPYQKKFLLDQSPRRIVLKARQVGFCLHPQTKILTSDLIWKTLDEVKIGEKIIAMDEILPGKRKQRKMRTAIIEAKSEVYEPAFRIKMDNGRELIATKKHRFLSKVRGGKDTIWRTVENTRIGDSIRYITKAWGESTYEDGWIGGMIDGEGSFRIKTGVEATISQRPGTVLDRVKKYMDSKGFVYRIENDNRKSKEGGKYGNKPTAKIVLSRMSDVFSLFGITRPSRFIDFYWWENRRLPSVPSGSWSKVISIESLKKQRMIDLQTSEKTFIAEGFVSHNSTTLALEALIRVINPDKTVLMTSVSDRQSQELMDKVAYFLRQLKNTELEFPKTGRIAPFDIYRETKTEKIFETDSRIISLPNSPQTVCGYRADYGYIDEFAKFEGDQEMMNAIEPSLSRGGKLALNSTPFGKRGLFYNIWEDAEKMGYSKHEVPWTSCPDPNYQKEINKFKNSWDPFNFGQEYELRFVSEALSFFPYSLTLPCVNSELIDTFQLDTPNYVATGIDFGQKSSQSVAITVEKTEKKIENKSIPMIIVRNVKAWKLLTKYKKIENDVSQMYKDLNPSIIRVDQTGLGQSITEFLRNKLGAAVQGLNFTNPIKERMATDLRNLFENKQIEIPDNRTLLHQLNSLERNVSDIGTVRYRHAKGEHDDYVWALCLACFGMTRPKPFMGIR